MIKPIIIGIHGLSNKPSRSILAKWWLKSLKEGLQIVNYSGRNPDFELVYWAHHLYDRPQDPAVTNSDSPYYLNSPYVPYQSTIESETASNFRRQVLDFLDDKLDDIFFNPDRIINFDRIADRLIKQLFNDLYRYYDDNCISQTGKQVCVRDAIRAELMSVLTRNHKHPILLIAHSMGSIIAIDVLNRLPENIHVDTLITIGSPLGLPPVLKRIMKSLNMDTSQKQLLPTPEAIRRRWINLADLNDHVAANYELAGDFSVNSGGVAPVDYQVANNYRFQDEWDHHKSYGYLRTPELAGAIVEFMEVNPRALSTKFRNIWIYFRKLVSK